MADILVVYSGKKGISTEIVSKSIASLLADNGHNVKLHHITDDGMPKRDDLKGAVVVNTSYAHVDDILSQTRFGGVPKVVFTIMLINFDLELTLPEKMKYFGYYATNTYRGVPLYNISMTPFAHAEMVGVARQLLAPSLAQNITAKFIPMTYGVDTSFFKPSKIVPALENFIVPYNRVNDSQKKIKTHMEVMSKFSLLTKAKRGKTITSRFFCAPKFIDKAKSFAGLTSIYDVQLQPLSRSDYLKNAQKSSIFLSTSCTESFGIYYLELLLCGVVGVFKSYPWVEKLLPDYRFTVDGSDLVSTLNYVYNNYDECREYVLNEVSPFIKREYSLTSYGEKLSKIIQERE